MTEAEWRACTDAQAMLEYVRGAGRVTGRKLRLFAVACCRRLAPLLSEEARFALDVAELLADGEVTEEARRAARDRAFHAPWVGETIELPSVGPVNARHLRGSAKQSVTRTLARDPADAATFAQRVSQAGAIALTLRGRPDLDYDAAARLEQTFQADVLRDLIGGLPLAVRPEPPWLNATVVAIARGAYDDRHMPSGELDPTRLAVLADALEDAGCADEAILCHLRGPGPHVRGCWVVDLLTGRS